MQITINFYQVSNISNALHDKATSWEHQLAVHRQFLNFQNISQFYQLSKYLSFLPDVELDRQSKSISKNISMFKGNSDSSKTMPN